MWGIEPQIRVAQTPTAPMPSPPVSLSYDKATATLQGNRASYAPTLIRMCLSRLASPASSHFSIVAWYVRTANPK